jgi:predicted Zn-dependent protease
MSAHGFPDAADEIRDWAIDWYESLEPDTLVHPLYRYGYARMLYFDGRLEEADAQFQVLVRETPDSVGYHGYRGSTAARLGDRERAMQISESLTTLDRPFRFGGIAYWQARIAAVLGDREVAIAKLRQALDEGFVITDAFHRDFDLQSLRGYEPFEEMLRPKG